MPNHVHLLVWPHEEAAAIDQLLFAIKRPFSYRVKQWLIAAHDPLLARLTVRQRPGKTTFRFWQEGPGHDRNLVEPTWAEGAVDYIHRNPVRRGLCERATDWLWSSARWYADPTATPNPRLPGLTCLPSDFLDSQS